MPTKEDLEQQLHEANEKLMDAGIIERPTLTRAIERLEAQTTKKIKDLKVKAEQKINKIKERLSEDIAKEKKLVEDQTGRLYDSSIINRWYWFNHDSLYIPLYEGRYFPDGLSKEEAEKITSDNYAYGKVLGYCHDGIVIDPIKHSL